MSVGKNTHGWGHALTSMEAAVGEADSHPSQSFLFSAVPLVGQTTLQTHIGPQRREESPQKRLLHPSEYLFHQQLHINCPGTAASHHDSPCLYTAFET